MRLPILFVGIVALAVALLPVHIALAQEANPDMA